MSAPGIVREGEDWKCTICGGINHCYCDEEWSDPICECGWPGWACHCLDEEEGEIYSGN